eukprot:219562_1
MNVDIIKSGYLKQKSSYLKQIRKRWVVLEGHKIYCYKHDKDHLIQIVNLDVYSILEFNNINPLEFELKTKGKKQQIHQFVARSAEDRQQWIRHIQDVRNRYQHQLMNKKSPTYNEESDSENNLLRDHNEEQYLAEFRVAEWKTFYVNYQMHDKFIAKLNCKIKRFKQMKLRRSKLKALKIDAELIQNMLEQEIDLVDGFFCSQLQLCQLMRDHHEKFQKVTYEANTSAHSTILAELLKLTINLKTYVFQNYVALSNLINRIEPMISFICNVKQKKFKIMNNVKNLLKTLHNMHILKSHSLVKEMRNKSLKDYTFVKKQTKKEIEPEVTPLIKEIENADVDYWSEEYKDEGSFGHNPDVTIESSGSNYVLDIDSKQKSTDTNTTMSNTAKTFTISSAWPSTNEGMNYYSTAHIKPRRYYGCNVIPENKQKCYLASCQCLHSLIEIMNGYKQCINGKYKQIFDDNMNVNNVLNSFLHLMQMHSHTDEEFEMISNLFGKCNINNCNIFKRRGNPKLQNDNPQHACRYQILDKIHCFYIHSFDIGYKLTRKEKQYILNQRSEQKQNDFTFDSTSNHIYKIIANKLKLNKNVKDVALANRANKFKTNTIESRYQPSVYDFGYRFFYWNYYKNKFEINDEVIYQNIDDPVANEGYCINDFFVIPKYGNLKKELVNNAICAISYTEWNTLVESASIHLRSHFARTIKCAGPNRKTIYNIENGKPIGFPHIAAMMVYCNYDQLQSAFSATYRRISRNEYYKQIIQRHSKYAHLGRLLREFVECFGSTRSRCEGSHLFGKKLYHGITIKSQFATIKPVMKGPTSTTMDYTVAVNFSGGDGTILQLRLHNIVSTSGWSYGSDSGGSRMAFVDCSWLSDYPNEQERFFIGGWKHFYIDTIIIASSGENYQLYIDAMKAFAIVTSTLGFHFDVTATTLQMFFRIFSHILWTYYRSNDQKGYQKFSQMPMYGERLLHNFCANVKILNFWGASVTFDSVGFPKNYLENLRKMIRFWFFNEYGWLNLNELTTVFPKVKEIYLNIGDGLMIIKNRATVTSIASIINNKRVTGLKKIVINLGTINEECKNIAMDVITKTKQYFVDTNWNLVLVTQNQTYKLIIYDRSYDSLMFNKKT